MKAFEKPKNRWGWGRIAGYVAAAAIPAWALAAAGLRGVGGPPWMAWSGYQSFSLLRGLELAVVALAAAFFAGWMEEHTRQHEIAMIHLREAELVRAQQRAENVQRFRDALQALLAEAGQDLAETRVKIARLVWASLREMDGKGKGEVLSVLFEKKLLDGDIPCSEMISEDFSGVILANAELSGICLEGIDLTRAQLSGAQLEGSQLSGSILCKAILRKADLRAAALNGCNLRGANLDGANLEGADLRGANLDGALLRNANLKNCTIHGFQAGETDSGKTAKRGGQERSLANLSHAILVDTILPDGRKITNDRGQKFLRDEEFAILVDKL